MTVIGYVVIERNAEGRLFRGTEPWIFSSAKAARKERKRLVLARPERTYTIAEVRELEYE